MRSGFLVSGAIGPVAFGGSGASGIPADPVPVAGAELLTNGDFEAGDTGWAKGTGWTIPGDGTAVKTGASGSFLWQVVLGFEAQKWYQIQHSIVSHVSGTVAMLFDGYKSSPSRSALGSYVDTYASVAPTTNGFFVWPSTNSMMSVDNISYKPLILSTLISVQSYASPDCDISAAVTRTAGTQAGFAVRVDDPANPQNFIISYLDGAGNLKTDKCLAGVYTAIAGLTGAVTYVAGQRPRIVCAGNDVSVYYNGVQVGSTTAVADAGITGNKNHGLFSTYAANTFTGYTAA